MKNTEGVNDSYISLKRYPFIMTHFKIVPVSVQKYIKPCRIVLLIAVFLSVASLISAQSADSLFKQGSRLAYQSQYDSAIVLLQKACILQPQDMEMRLTLARAYAWSHDYKNAEQNAQIVLDNQPKNRDAMGAMADIYLWSKNWAGLESITQNALNKTSSLNLAGVTDSVVFIQKYALGLIEQKLFDEAVKVLSPFRKPLKPLWNIAILKLRRNTLSVYTSYYDFSNAIPSGQTTQKDWQTAAVEYIRRQRRVSILATLNYARRFENQGTQWLFQAYPKIGHSAYAQLIFAYSDGKVFPNLTYGGSFFANFRKYWELEAGIRIYQVNTPLLQNKTERTTVLRGGISYQKQQHRFAYVILKIDGIGVSGFAHNLSYRHYLKDSESYWQLAIGTGANINNQLTLQYDSFIINSRVISALVNRWLNDRWRVMGGMTWEQNKNTDGSRKSRMTYDLGVGFRF